jgi:hypothetical protein
MLEEPATSDILAEGVSSVLKMEAIDSSKISVHTI